MNTRKIVSNTLYIILALLHLNANCQQIISVPFKIDTTKIELEYEAYISGKDTIKNGNYKKFYLYSDAIYEEGAYLNNKKNGVFITYYENKEKHWVRNYSNDNLLGNEQFFSSDGSLEFTGLYSNTNDSSKVFYQQYYPSGELKKTNLLIKNKFDGQEVTFFLNGDTNSIKTFKNGILHGSFEIRNQRNQIIQKGSYEQGNLSGKLESFHNNGIKKTVGLFSNGLPHGDMKDYYPSGVLKRHCNYQNDTLQGPCKTYYVNGNLATSAIFSNGFFDKLYLSFYDSGVIKDSINYLANKKNGTSKHFDEDGNLLSLENFKMGIFHGKQKTYHPNHKIHKDFNYKDGIKTGKNYSYYNDGTLESVLIFNTENQIIKEKTFWNTAQVKTETKHQYKKNNNSNRSAKLDHLAKVKSFHENGKISEKGQLLNGKKIGVWIDYHSNGNKKLMTEYKFDKKHGQHILYFDNKKIKSKGEYTNNKKTGSWEYYNLDGEIIKQENYKNGKLHGNFFIKNEQTTESGTFKNGKKHGKWIIKGLNETKTMNYINDKLVSKQ